MRRKHDRDEERKKEAKVEPAAEAEAASPEEPAPSAAPELSGATPEELRKALAERDEKIDFLMRSAAELDNRRKRIERQMEERSRYALQDLAREMLPVIDHFELALGHAEQSRDFDALHDGLKLVHDQLLAVLKKFHVERIEALGKPFDPNHHETVGQVESAEHPDHTVVDVQQEGYMLHDRVLRPSRVIISRPPREDEETPAANAEAERPDEPK